MAKPFILYDGFVKLSDLYQDIDEGYRHFYSSGFVSPLKNRDQYDFLLCLSPELYYHFPIVEVMNHYLIRHGRPFPVMALTAAHEAISNALLWGLLKVERSDDFFEFSRIIETRLAEIKQGSHTLTVGVILSQEDIKVHIVNPAEEGFSLDKFRAHISPYFRGSQIMKLFAGVSYHSKSKTLILTFEEAHDVHEAALQS